MAEREDLSLFAGGEDGGGGGSDPAAGGDIGVPGEAAPLAARMRPRTLDDYVGQEHILGPGRALRELIEKDAIGSVIFWGPPGTGKTTLARIIADRTDATFVHFSAVTEGIARVRE
ncbi:MAG TPA: AAA family ATPase, partial [Longimicrobiales bacterium]|nr:AAA family ATPase [Longimicrobiales bacterium]